MQNIFESTKRPQAIEKRKMLGAFREKAGSQLLIRDNFQPYAGDEQGLENY